MGMRRQLKKLCKHNELVTIRGALDYFPRVRIIKVGRKLITFSHQYKDDNKYEATVTTLQIADVKYFSRFDHIFDRSLKIQIAADHPDPLENKINKNES
jgi:hypothetical protein